MINNRVGAFPQATVNTLLDESYLVVKSVYLKLKEIVDVADHLETITTLAEHLEEIENVQTAANRVNRVWESIDNIDRLTESAANIDTVAGSIADVNTVAKASDQVVLVAKNIAKVNTVADNIDKVTTVADAKEDIHQVVVNLDAIKGAKQNAEDAQKYAKASLSYSLESADSATLAKKWATQGNSPVQGDLYSAKYYAELADRVADKTKSELESTLNKSTTEAVNKLNEIVAQKKDELVSISETYYIPAVSAEGVLSWTNTGDKENPPEVNIKGEKGDPGTSLIINGQVANYAELIYLHPEGIKGDVYQFKDTGHVWGWDTEKNQWVDFGELKGNKGDPGQSVNEFLMNPDPELYFLSIYGETSGDIIGDLTVLEDPFDPDPTEVLETILKE